MVKNIDECNNYYENIIKHCAILLDNEKEVLLVINKDPYINSKSLAKILSCGLNKTKEILKHLQNRHLLTHQKEKTGYKQWFITFSLIEVCSPASYNPEYEKKDGIVVHYSAECYIDEAPDFLFKDRLNKKIPIASFLFLIRNEQLVLDAIINGCQSINLIQKFVNKEFPDYGRKRIKKIIINLENRCLIFHATKRLIKINHELIKLLIRFYSCHADETILPETSYVRQIATFDLTKRASDIFKKKPIPIFERRNENDKEINFSGYHYYFNPLYGRGEEIDLSNYTKLVELCKELTTAYNHFIREAWFQKSLRIEYSVFADPYERNGFGWMDFDIYERILFHSLHPSKHFFHRPPDFNAIMEEILQNKRDSSNLSELHEYLYQKLNAPDIIADVDTMLTSKVKAFIEQNFEEADLYKEYGFPKEAYKNAVFYSFSCLLARYS